LSRVLTINPGGTSHKGIRSTVSGAIDLFLLPNIECGNLVGKTLMFYAGARMAGVILGATRPIVLRSPG
jgi:phosphate butyryltransferase